MVYNARDELILSQDGKQNANSEWSFTKYDALGRVVLTGIFTHLGIVGTPEVQRAAMQTAVENYELRSDDNPANDNPLFESRVLNADTYSAIAFPLSSVHPQAALNILTVNYYDDYSFRQGSSYVYTDFAYESPGSAYETTAFNRTKGKLTGSKVKVLNPASLSDLPSWLLSVSYYDPYSRVIQTRMANHIGGVDVASSQYDFAGKLLQTHIKHTRENPVAAGETEEITVQTRNEFDHGGRVTASYEKINDAATEEQLAAIHYNEIGEVITKEVGRKPSETFLQQMDYSYNIRGWMSAINNPDEGLGMARGVDVFAMRLFYQDATSNPTITSQFNGNIAGMRWKTGTDNVARTYNYGYDPLNRITSASYSNNADGATLTPAPSESFAVENITYDKNGNLLSMDRKVYSAGQQAPQGLPIIT